MPELIDTFGVFNNKGGVGKTTLSFQLLCRFAEEHPNEAIVAMDLCPQANLSQLLLTNAKVAGAGAGRLALTRGDVAVKDRASKALTIDNLPKTVAGAMVGVTNNDSFLSSTNIKETFLMRAADTNPNVPDNIYLLCGDACLDTLANGLLERSNMKGQANDMWHNVFTSLKRVFDKLPLEFDKDVYGFVDTNPALTIYTQIGLVATSKLIIPVAADEFSAVAVNEIFTRVYAMSEPAENALKDMSEESFEYKVRTKKYAGAGPRKIELPKIHMVIMNKTPLHYKGQAHYSNPVYEKACEIMGEEGFFGNCYNISHEVLGKQVKGSTYFSDRGTVPDGNWGQVKDDFLKRYLYFMSDLHTAGTVMSIGGLPISVLKDNTRLKNQIKQMCEAKGVGKKMLDRADMFLGYIVDHMTNNRGEAPRGVSTKAFLVDQKWSNPPPTATPIPADDEDHSDDESDTLGTPLPPPAHKVEPAAAPRSPSTKGKKPPSAGQKRPRGEGADGPSSSKANKKA